MLGKNCYMILDTFAKGFLIKFSQVSFNFLPPESHFFLYRIMVIHNF